MSNILQFKITLKHSNPKIWRRFQVESTIMFYDLHLIIQCVMGWSNSHLYQFVYNRNSIIGSPEMFDDEGIADANKTEIEVIFDKLKTNIKYEYNFGDGWEHEVILERILEKKPTQLYPNCIKGEMACPPDDCGGINGYYDLLEILKDKKHPEYDEVTEWIGDGFDPNYLDLEEINEALKEYHDMDLGFNL